MEINLSQLRETEDMDNHQASPLLGVSHGEITHMCTGRTGDFTWAWFLIVKKWKPPKSPLLEEMENWTFVLFAQQNTLRKKALRISENEWDLYMPK